MRRSRVRAAHRGRPWGQELLGGDQDGDHGHPAGAHHPSTTSIAITPALEPTQHSPNPKPDPAISRQRRRKCRLSSVNSYAPAELTTAPAAAVPCGRSAANTTAPARAQTARYDPAHSGTPAPPPAPAARPPPRAAPR